MSHTLELCACSDLAMLKIDTNSMAEWNSESLLCENRMVSILSLQKMFLCKAVVDNGVSLIDKKEKFVRES